MKMIKKGFAGFLAGLLCISNPAFAANHREAPITALDTKADITDYFSFVSYNDPGKVTFILNVDPLLEPSNGPNYFPFDPEIVYSIRIDNNYDAVEDVMFEFRFKTEVRLPDVFTGFVGAGNGINAPANAPAPIAPGTPIVPPAITALDGTGSEGLGLRQDYTVTMVKRNENGKLISKVLNPGKKLFAVPTNVGPRTMPNYPALADKGIYSLPEGVKVFAGTVEDPFYIDLGAAFDSLNLRTSSSGVGIPGVLSNAQDANDTTNSAADDVAGFNVNSIAIEVPISLITSDGQVHASTDPKATVGSWGVTERFEYTTRRGADSKKGAGIESSGKRIQVQRMGNPLINELLIGTGFKDKFSQSQPKDDSQFANFFLTPLLPIVLNAIYTSNLTVPDAPRTDLLPLVTYAAPIAAAGTPAGPVADLLRLNTGVAPTAQASRKRIGLLAGDGAGYPNGRRVSDDVTDISLRAVAGVLAGPPFNGFPHTNLGDGVNANDAAYREVFPYLGYAHSGRNSRHIDPTEAGGGSID